MKKFLSETGGFFKSWYRFLFLGAYYWLRHLEKGKSAVAEKLYQGRGKMVRPFLHSGMGGLVVLGIFLAPIITNSLSQDSFAQTPPPSAVLSSATETTEMSTDISDKKYRAEIIEYKVEPGDTLSGVSQKFGISIDSIRWANNLASINAIKPGQILRIPPADGIIHKVKKGDTVYSVAKYYGIDPQGIVDYPFNTFINDETFALAVGQVLIVPDGTMPKVELWSPGQAYIAQRTPDAGTVVASGAFVWPTSGTISQRYTWYHKGIDIANRAGTPVLAADAGKIIIAGWPDNIGYGNRVFIDHGNGFVTVYAHLSRVDVTVGQTVTRGNVVGLIGSTGRSTGPHLHFEIRASGKAQDPLAYLK
ncbi:hypothetical protein COS55_03315 [Candidatus Shapirobacteria bacterium CG03_land_8_20_14_0_80_40_19]|uniref:LysM domain-containing protein n=2 Tax=Candidatus Shapironibacteriota TaxID=1752721 RepID=A0A2M7BBS2_9BACT|nr:MAG: hypothetical protein COV89_00885 [Candidatus Shapirobacteria bacterium CG11_big_fil_rev_8_21_14_0_20_40_12]PIV00554.1 MAG: hypothetical protein COS55_03315 [Candidatus Shapirobacteria bacterium CG03_land_8_20_14_0_80_40_19]